MLNLSDKELDRLSREAADSYEPDDSSLSWSRLEQKLTEQMPGRPPDGFRFGRISPYIWGPAAVLIAGISFYIFKNSDYSPYSTRTVKTEKIKDSSLVTRGSAFAGQLAENHFTTDSASGNKNEGHVGLSEKAEATVPDPSRRVSSDILSGKESTNESGTGYAVSGNHFSNHRNRTRAPRAVDRGHHGNAVSRSVSDAGTASALSSVASYRETSGAGEGFALPDRSSVDRAGSAHSLPDLARSGAVRGQVNGNDSSLNKFSAPHVVKSMRVNRSLNVGFAFGPDYSNAGGIANNQISNNIGITVGYYLTRKLSVNTGIFYSNKFYWSPGKTSHSQTAPVPARSGVNYFAAPPPIEYVNGSCNMYEIPLTLRYDFAGGQKTKFFASAGLSSYFMVKQTDIYFFHNGMNAMAWKTTNNQQQNYWLGVAALSAGVETDLGKGFSFQAEPFLRLPLKNMGVEEVKINSYGFLLSFRYAPVLSRSKR